MKPKVEQTQHANVRIQSYVIVVNIYVMQTHTLTINIPKMNDERNYQTNNTLNINETHWERTHSTHNICEEQIWKLQVLGHIGN